MARALGSIWKYINCRTVLVSVVPLFLSLPDYHFPRWYVRFVIYNWSCKSFKSRCHLLFTYSSVFHVVLARTHLFVHIAIAFYRNKNYKALLFEINKHRLSLLNRHSPIPFCLIVTWWTSASPLAGFSVSSTVFGFNTRKIFCSLRINSMAVFSLGPHMTKIFVPCFGKSQSKQEMTMLCNLSPKLLLFSPIQTSW